MLYYLKAEVLGEAAAQALEGVPARYNITVCIKVIQKPC